MLNPAFGRRHGKAVFAQSFQVELDRLAHLGCALGHGGVRGDAAGQVGAVGAVVTFGLLDDDGVAQRLVATTGMSVARDGQNRCAGTTAWCPIEGSDAGQNTSTPRSTPNTSTIRKMTSAR